MRSLLFLYPRVGLLIVFFLFGASCEKNRSSTSSDAGSDAADADFDDLQQDAACNWGDAGNFPEFAHHSVELRPEGFLVDGQWITLRGGTVQWFRIPKGEWRDRLRKFSAAFNTVDVYVPWNIVEPEPGRFVFDDLIEFLELCKEYGLFVYFRPGPYICNEMNGGGVPSWLIPLSDKKSIQDDGRINFRTQDPDWLSAVQNYFSHLNQAIFPYLITRGGPILLYAVENEYNWFEIFAGVDKAAWYEGSTERPVGQNVDTTQYLAALRDFVQADGIDVPVTTCPGDSKISGMGDVYGIVPMPNFYISGGTEKLAYDVVTSMHDPASYDGRYLNVPSGTTESERRATRMVRTFFGGMDAYFAFNAAGMATPGRHNALVLDNSGLFSMLDPSVDRVVQAFISPRIGYFHNVVDYYGPIGPAGTLREKYYQFRARHLFFNALDSLFAPLLHPLRSGDFNGADPRMHVADDRVGALENGRRVHYWFLAPNGTWFAQLLNESTQPIVLPPGSVTIDGVSFPRYTHMMLPISPFPGAVDSGQSGINATASPEELHYSHISVGRLQLQSELQLLYTTGEILTWREFNGTPLLVMTAPLGTEAEVVLAGHNAPPALMHASEGIDTPACGANELALTWVSASTPQVARVQSGNQSLLVWFLPTEQAGRWWFFRTAGQDAAIGPLEDFELRNDDACHLQTQLWVGRDAQSIYLFSERNLKFEGTTILQAFSEQTGMTVLSVPPKENPPDLQELNLTVRSGPLPAENWVSLGESSEPLEIHGVEPGPVWLRARANIANPDASGKLYADHASDIVSIYVNNNYITTVCPVGTEIDNQSLNSNYRFQDLRPYLRTGENEVLFRIEVWGHGSFMWPRGRIIATSAQIPSLGFDAFKGIWGDVKLGGQNLVHWEMNPGSPGEKLGWHLPEAADGFYAATLPLKLQKGQTLWIRAELPAQAVQTSGWRPPLGISLRGRNLVGTIWLNGHLIGRWLSDEDFLQRGAWTRALRSMWMNTSPDSFPLPDSWLDSQARNVIAIELHDVSGDSDPDGGALDSLQLGYFAEEKGFNGGESSLVTRQLFMFPLEILPASK